MKCVTPLLALLIALVGAVAHAEDDSLYDMLHDIVVDSQTRPPDDWRRFQDTNPAAPNFSEKQWQNYKQDRSLRLCHDNELFENFLKRSEAPSQSVTK